MARCERPVVPLLRQRAVGVRRARPDAAARGLDQRHYDCGEGPAVSLAGTGAAAGGCGGVGDGSVLSLANNSRPHGEEPQSGVSNHAGPVAASGPRSFETRASALLRMRGWTCAPE